MSLISKAARVLANHRRIGLRRTPVMARLNSAAAFGQSAEESALRALSLQSKLQSWHVRANALRCFA
jgi:hypothetical protein